MAKQYVLTHEEMGIFLGMALGMGFWSKIDPVGQPSACAFDTKDEALYFAKETHPRSFQEIKAVEVDTGSDPGYVTIAECVAAGLPEWKPEG